MASGKGRAHQYGVYLRGDSNNPDAARDAARDLAGLHRSLSVGTQCVSVEEPRQLKGGGAYLISLVVRGGNVQQHQVEQAVTRLMQGRYVAEVRMNA